MILNDDGTIELAGQTLRRPTIGELWDFQDAAIAATEAFKTEADTLQAEIDGIEGDDVPDAIADRIRKFRRRGLLDHMAPIYVQLFATLGDEPPGPVEEWDVELLDSTIPRRIIDHWKNTPKASGGADQKENPEPPPSTS